MKFDSCKHQRRSIRLKGYDYAQPGAYFVTLCTWQREDLFGEVVGGDVRLSALGKVVKAEWERLASRFPNIALDAFVVMPNHLHGIIVIHEPDVGATHNMYNVIPSGKSNMQTEFGDPHDGSPKFDRLPESIGSPVDANDGLSGNRGTVTQCAMAEPLNRETRATRHSPTGASNDDRYGATKSEGWVDGSPLQNDDVDRVPGYSPPRIGVGATQNQPFDAMDGIEYSYIDSGDRHGGSPVDANDESTYTNETGTQSAMAEPLDRETRATRHSPTDASMDVRYEDTEFGECVDGSPLRNDDVDRDNDDGLPNRMNEELLDNRKMGMKYTTTDSLERENRATRHSPTDASMDVRYEDTEFGECVDGSPLRNDGMDRAPKRPARGSLGAMIGQFKSRVTKRIWAIPEFDHTPIWQRNYYEHIIRNEADWRRTCKYIRENPLRWEEDQLHPDAPPNPFNQDKEHG